MELRDYQTQTIDRVFQYISDNEGKNPVVVAPTGAGKSILIAEICRRGLSWWPDTKILILSHQKELLEQDAAKLRLLLPSADIGVYSASLGKKEVGHSVTFASIQTIARSGLTDFEVVLIDECHLINNEETGQYRTFLSTLNCRVIGFTATPYRLSQGSIVEDGSLFDDAIESVSILSLQKRGFLSYLRTKGTANHIDVSEVSLRGGEYVSSELDEAVNAYATNESVTDEIVGAMKAFDRKHLLVFCTSVEHARTISDLLNMKGVSCTTVEGSMSKKDREAALADFTSGRVQAITNCNILTTGFDYPAIDIIAMLRPTMSPGLYSQMLGRGLRIDDSKKDCLVLDFVGNCAQHGPVTDIIPPKKHVKGEGLPPSKTCPECLEIVHLSTPVCPCCGHVFPKHSAAYLLFQGDINGGLDSKYLVKSWTWIERTSKKGLPMVEVTYSTDRGEVKEYILTGYDGWAGYQAYQTLCTMAEANNISVSAFTNDGYTDMGAFWRLIAQCPAPVGIITRQDGKYTKVVYRLFDSQFEEEYSLDEKEREEADALRQSLYSR